VNIPDVSRNWHYHGSLAQLEELMSLFGDFHDSCVREAHIVTGHYVDSDYDV
jgi:hypothetical protein